MVFSLTPHSRLLSSARAEELYLTIAPVAGQSPAVQAERVYTTIRESLAARGAGIFAERVFVAPAAREAVADRRRAILGEVDDGIAAAQIGVAPGRTGEFAGVQVHAVTAEQPPQPVRCAECSPAAQGRELRLGDDRWLMLLGLCPGGEIPPGEQARKMFDCAACFLHRAGADMRSVARTWLWLKDVCDWYGDLNAVRTAFFEREGLIRRGNGRGSQSRSVAMGDGRPRLPASTGIGIGPAGGGACCLDLIALPGAEDRIEFMEAAGQQNSAFAYGSAFSRAAVAPMPGGRVLLVSGTAAIDAGGRTEHVGQIEHQIEATIEHARALLAQAGLRDEHVLSALAYCKTPEVEEAFRSGWGELGWPVVSMIAEICRPELLFEVELTAGPVPEGVRCAT